MRSAARAAYDSKVVKSAGVGDGGDIYSSVSHPATGQTV
jgi:hypothetical protein